ncbi:MAG: NADPH:quinone reductase-like Zn-dependent oxidoreductase [Candidatus Krumholzibacteriia bacterium]|jgi:NADPH:quinone reductase-like Zn-dependent oxidoreductase
MKAITHLNYGGPDLLAVAKVAEPQVGNGEVLVRVQTAAVNKGDWHILTGKPYLIRLAGYGLCKPKRQVFGQEFAGIVEDVGHGVTKFAPGDRVFGEVVGGAFAQRICVKEESIASIPDGVSVEEAAAIPSSALTALQGLREHGQVQAGQKVLIIGAAGGVGTFAVQLAKHFGAEVTGVCSSINKDFVSELGADHVIDYTASDFALGEQRYDLIFDLVGNRTLADCCRVLAENGVYVGCTGEGNDWVGPIGRMLEMAFYSLTRRARTVGFVVKPNAEDMAYVADLVASGKISPAIGERYDWADVTEALRRQGTGHVRGKNVLVVN